MSFPRRFNFHGAASGVAAHVYWPENKVLPVQAASSLPVIGGLSESKAGPGNLGDYVHFQSAETSAHGEYVDHEQATSAFRGEKRFDTVPTRTTVSSRVRGLHVGKRVSIGVADAGLVSHHPQNGVKHPSIKLTGNRLDNVMVDNHQLQITLEEDLFCECDTLQKLQAAYEKGLRPDQIALFMTPDGSPPGRKFPSSDGVVLCTVVKNMSWVGDKHPDAKIQGNLLTVPDFGKVYFGMMLIGEATRRLTMVRMQLGSPTGGEMAAAEAESNGSNWPE